ncbi:MAG: hypothetical protein HY789_01265 [Deltaproteobacteria bacterium]|nr:hypothetical protein [Deltaproteobacteria bacterium]
MIKKESPEGQIFLVLWRSILDMAGPIAEYYRWILTGVTAILALIVANLNSLLQAVEKGYLKAAIILLVASILFGLISYVLSVCVKLRVEISKRLEPVLGSPEAKSVIAQIQLEKEEFIAEMRRPFVWPIDRLMQRAAEKGSEDNMSSEKGSIKLFCWQAYAMWCCLFFAASSLFVLAIGMK